MVDYFGVNSIIPAVLQFFTSWMEISNSFNVTAHDCSLSMRLELFHETRVEQFLLFLSYWRFKFVILVMHFSLFYVLENFNNRNLRTSSRYVPAAIQPLCQPPCVSVSLLKIHTPNSLIPFSISILVQVLQQHFASFLITRLRRILLQVLHIVRPNMEYTFTWNL